MEPKRIDRILSQYGYCSRKEAKGWVRQGRVQRSDGFAIRSVAEKADPRLVWIDGAPIDQPEGLFIVLHKPLGLICAHDAPLGQNVYELLPPQWMLRHPQPVSVGRLDKDTSGLLLITDVGAIVHAWTSPRHAKPKVYEVRVDRPLQEVLISSFASGELCLTGEDKPCLPAELVIRSDYEATLTLYEGRFHQVRRMFLHFGYQVLALHRTQVGPFTLQGLPPGQYQCLPLPTSPA